MNNLALGYLTILLTSNVEESDLKYGRAMEKDGYLATIAKGSSFENASIFESDQYTSNLCDKVSNSSPPAWTIINS